MFLSRLFKTQRANAIGYHEKNMLRLVESNKDAALLDIGCDDGVWTLKIANTIGTKSLYGMEVIAEAARKSEMKKIIVAKADISDRFPYKSETFDVVHANMVIEHLYKTEHFVKEIFRVLKPGGYCVIGTDNLASWHNIVSLMFGWMPMASTNYS